MGEAHWTDEAVKVDSVQVNAHLRKSTHEDYALYHWCPGCAHLHPLFLSAGWRFNGDLEKPTFVPSFKHTLHDDAGNQRICHYVITNGQVAYCGDSDHPLKNQTIPLPELPEGLRD